MKRIDEESMEQAYQKPLLFILNEPERYHGLFIETFDFDFSVTFVPALTPQLKRQLKQLAQQDEIGDVSLWNDITKMVLILFFSMLYLYSPI
jgi:hypothetical protein